MKTCHSNPDLSPDSGYLNGIIWSIATTLGNISEEKTEMLIRVRKEQS